MILNNSSEIIKVSSHETVPELTTENYRSHKESLIVSEVRRIKNSIEPIEQYSVSGENVLEELSQIRFLQNKSQTYSMLTKPWIGCVTDIKNDVFTAKLEDAVINGTHELAEFSISKISPEDLPLLSKGAIFYWSVGDVMNNSQLKEEAILRFQRSNNWTEEELDEAADTAKEQFGNISWDDFNTEKPQA